MRASATSWPQSRGGRLEPPPLCKRSPFASFVPAVASTCQPSLFDAVSTTCAGAGAVHESTATPSRSTPLPKHVGEPYLLGLPLPEIWRHGVSVLRATFDQRDSFVFLTGSGRIVWLLPGSRPPFARTMESFVREDTPSYLIVL